MVLEESGIGIGASGIFNLNDSNVTIEEVRGLRQYYVMYAEAIEKAIIAKGEKPRGLTDNLILVKLGISNT
ncbi:MAG: hypothetical protein H0V82_10605 [Candidatus Protochlamydia sp.]|nr:hypothetical protein [Candidatus Protochlamydia sp.]